MKTVPIRFTHYTGKGHEYNEVLKISTPGEYCEMDFTIAEHHVTSKVYILSIFI